ncbi:aldehyde ferredoxin oxidoreductase N-terminal domain-containing protein [Tissierella sp. Yu-01]|uniref:aldehyde ferredoxin oxidoreductase N-terminal domain-containing protein n=1 Tax=Tissierella sp. Yu-01 TaxID=3035694 RepID=UPI00240D9833|nr:aldehyde ferredoxin oxidoreductase N-terminal domain-containing protein [Tissierella sp. Yu-01]WFA10013.1 aldehyde ferredoxin oxidoreductase N-terminal domain-containing protein [Tissierella sp. Yu-01]
MGKIIHVDLKNKQITEKSNDTNDYGRGLLVKLIDEYVPQEAHRFDDDNIVVLAPGLFSGTLAPSTGRLLVGTKESNNGGILTSNMAGTISQKLASLNIEAIILSGRNIEDIPLSIIVDDKNISLEYIREIKGLKVSSTIEKFHQLYGKNCGIIGIGPSGENMLPVSSLFSTYPEGNPSFYCARNSIGDVFGHKNVKAIVVNNKAHFNSPVNDMENFKKASKKLSRLIIDHPICGKALPGLGSITLMKMMQQGKFIEFNVINNNIRSTNDNLNRTCSPLCVVGCLNRHATSDDDFYSAPAESEASAALFDAFGIDDKKYVKDFTNRCFELGIDCMEFIFSCEMYFKLQNIKGNIEELDNAIEGIRNMTLNGRIIGSKTDGIYNLFRERKEFKRMVSKPSVVEESNFNIDIPSKTVNIPGISDLEYLYAYVIVLENLGFCLFTSFAFLDSKIALTLLADMYYYKTGQKVDEKDLLEYAIKSLNNEKKIPNFIKVLYRYFNSPF